MKIHRPLSHFLIPIAAGVFLLCACTMQQPPLATPPAVDVEWVSLTTSDGVRLDGTLYLGGHSPTAVLLAHQGTAGASQDDWQPFAYLVAGKGFASLTFDFRGFGHSAGGVSSAGQLATDLDSAINLLHDRGYSRILCIGACQGGTACLQAAAEGKVAGVATIASPMSLDDTLTVRQDQLSRLTIPKLFLSAKEDTVKGKRTGLEQSAQTLYDFSPEPKSLRLIPGTAHGTDLFATPSGEELRDALASFVEGFR